MEITCWIRFAGIWSDWFNLSCNKSEKQAFIHSRKINHMAKIAKKIQFGTQESETTWLRAVSWIRNWWFAGYLDFQKFDFFLHCMPLETIIQSRCSPGKNSHRDLLNPVISLGCSSRLEFYSQQERLKDTEDQSWQGPKPNLQGGPSAGDWNRAVGRLAGGCEAWIVSWQVGRGCELAGQLLRGSRPAGRSLEVWRLQGEK